MSIADQITRIQNEVGVQSNKIAEILNAMENQKAIEASIIDGTIIEYRNDRITFIADNAFQGYQSLTSVDFPLVTTIGECAFKSCKSLTSVNFPLATIIGTYAFNGCKSLTSVDFSLAVQINHSTFAYCTTLTSVTLRSPTVATLTNTSAFYKTPIESGTGYIYVPAELIDSYKTTTNWDAYANQIKAIEEM